MKWQFPSDLEEEALISDTDVHGRLIVVLRVEDALIVLCLYRLVGEGSS